ncbi:MAG: Dabb family protein [Marinicaulis sp.]|nr:Dabb family protein [Marinicaulis sp.]NNE39894.1 Dabb family protein [Marinicaulis sp.]NNL88794.1 Dabb family protein [Marinicaulis sp.]
MLRHIVFFSAQDCGDLEKIVDGLRNLERIPSADRLEVKVNKKLDKISNEIDVIVYGEFVDEIALEEFKNHPAYDESTRAVRPLREMRFVADFDADE